MSRFTFFQVVQIEDIDTSFVYAQHSQTSRAVVYCFYRLIQMIWTKVNGMDHTPMRFYSHLTILSKRYNVKKVDQLGLR